MTTHGFARRFALVLVATAALAALGSAQAIAGLATGEVEQVLALPSGNSPEGIAVDRTGTIYVGNRRIENGLVNSEILKLADGTVSTFAVLPASASVGPLGTSGVLGLAIDRHRNVYAALATFDLATNGVWRLSSDGSNLTRLAGSQQIGFPNGLTFDSRGDLYVTDSFAGVVWRFEAEGDGGAPWLQHELLQPLPFDPLGVQLPGANGIAFSPPNHLYVANTERGLIAHIPINLADGNAGAPTVAAQGFSLLTVDGIAVDVFGTVHAVVPAFAILGTSPLVRVDPITGSTVSTVNPSDFAEFDVPLSVAFGAGDRDHRSVLVTNGDLPLIPGGPGAGVVQAGVGVPGFPIA